MPLDILLSALLMYKLSAPRTKIQTDTRTHSRTYARVGCDEVGVGWAMEGKEGRDRNERNACVEYLLLACIVYYEQD